MTTSLPLGCACGKMRGHARLAGRPLRFVCYCSDCQALAHYLDRADDVLDAYGGTEMLQLSPARVELTEGTEHLACVRLSDKGLMRWYAGCCRTPIANTMARPRMPFVGLVQTFASPQLDAAERERVLGPVRARVNGQFSIADANPEVSMDRFPVMAILSSIRAFAGGWIRGEHRPSPFFDLERGTPRATPRVLGEDEREALRRAVERWRSS